ncbi:MAG: sulfatase-like hydrolase/transferase [Bacteroidia bacterium]|nr:sulfatase-like hydrolase/transferase [Bacteroidia bacterium]
MCSPSRASLLTSRYGSEVGITDWINHDWNQALAPLEPHLGLDTSYTTWPELFAQAGYATALIGKWHLGRDPKYHPKQHGYQVFQGFLGGGTSVKNPTLQINGQDSLFSGLTTDILTDLALRYLDQERNQPFLLSLHYRAPHAPWRPLRDKDFAAYQSLAVDFPHSDYPKLDTAELTRKSREYFGSISSVDRSVKRILQKLKEKGLASNTLILFTSDHGYNMGHNGIWHKGNGHWILTESPPATENIPQGQRPNMYDHSLKVPAIIAWPGIILPNRVIKETLTMLDWYPTLLALANIPQPPQLKIRGRDFSPLLMGKTLANWDNDFYGEYSTHQQSRTHMRTYRTPEWKLTMDYRNPERSELYDLKRDPEETTNLYPNEKYRSIRQELEKKIRQKMQNLGDRVLSTADK